MSGARPVVAVVMLGGTLVSALVCAASAAPPPATVTPLPPALRDRMIGRSWHVGCPVGLDGLRLVRVRLWGFDGKPHSGRLVVHGDVATGIARVFERLFAAHVPIRRAVPIDAYGGDDFRSIEADNTSAFNCRYVDGTTRWSEHAYGRAIDVNPIENPYVTSAGTTSHSASRRFVRRTPARPGMAVEGGPLVRAFAAEGWAWGGRWRGAKDYQHFSTTGR